MRYEAGAVELEVRDDGTGGPARRRNRPRPVGMRERVAMFGGRARGAAGAEGGGFAVRARLPVGHHGVIRLLLADDQALVRGGFRLILDAEADMEVVGRGGRWRARRWSGRVATQPDVVLMDVRMPDLDGIEATRRLLDARCPTRAC